jgi:epoxide hydrolase
VTIVPDKGLRPFRFEVPQGELDDLYERLDRTRWPDELPDVGWAYGVPRNYLKELVRYWRHEYDWRAAEARLNEWPQFTTTIDGARIHFAHIRSAEPDATPLIIIHGWPGSIVEFTRIASPLADPRSHGGDLADAFDLVLPHIPGFGLSGPTHETGWEDRRVAAAFAELMRRLGYPRYGTQGGDWGAAISRELGRTQPEQVIGVHLNLLPSAHAVAEPTAQELTTLDPAERERTLASWQRTPAVDPRPPGLRRHPVHPPANPRLRTDRLPGGQTGLDRGEIQGVDRLARPPRRCRRPRPPTDQRHALLADRHRPILGSHLLRARTCPLLGSTT